MDGASSIRPPVANWPAPTPTARANYSGDCPTESPTTSDFNNGCSPQEISGRRRFDGNVSNRIDAELPKRMIDEVRHGKD